MSRPQFETPLVKPRYIGARVTRSDDPKYLTGQGEYLADLTLPGVLHVAFVRSSTAHARVLSIDVDAARELEGVHAVWTGADVEPLCPGLGAANAIPGFVPTVMPLVANEIVRYVGEIVVAVVAESRAIAEDACELVIVDYEALPAVTDVEAARVGGPLANEALDNNIALEGSAVYGDVDDAFERAAKVLEARYHTGRVVPAPLEARGCMAKYSWTTGELKVWSSTQIPHYIALFASIYLGFPEHLIEVRTPDTGGGFGLKSHVTAEEMVICLLARGVNRPVKWVEDRRENFMSGIHAHEQIFDISYALDAEGRIIGERMGAIGDGGPYHSIPWGMGIDPQVAVAYAATGIYDIPAFSSTHQAVTTNKVPMGAYRGVGCMTGTLGHEALADEAARELGISPFEFRRRNVVRSFPWTNAMGITYDEGSWPECIDELERLVDYDNFLDRQARLREVGRYIGLGMSHFVEIGGLSNAGLIEHEMVKGQTVYDSATVKLEPTGTVTVTTGNPTQGQGNRLTIAQIAADVIGVPLENITVRCGESSKYAHGAGTWGSRAGIVSGGAVLRSSHVIRERLKTLAATLLEASEHDITLADGKASVAGSPDKSIPITELAGFVYANTLALPEGLEPSLEVTLTYDPGRCIFSNGAHAFIVEVDIETGFVEVEHAFAVEDCGTMINPSIVEGQIRGGVAQGLGSALFEEIVYDDSGQLLTTTFADYLVPTIDVVPRFSFHHIETPSPHSPVGMKGMGESGLIASPGAMLNAVNDALAPLGATLRRIPLTPERIVDALLAARATG